MIKSKKLIAIFVSVAMLMTMLASFTTVTYADEAAPAYTTHLWDTLENTESCLESKNTTVTSIPGVYKNGVEAVCNGTGNQYIDCSFALDPAIKIEDALKNDLTVEVEFDYYIIGGASNNWDRYLYLASEKNKTSNLAALFRIKNTGEMRAYQGESTSNGYQKIKVSDATNITNFGTFKIVMHVEDTGYINPITGAATAEPTWVFDKLYYNGVNQQGGAKNDAGLGLGTKDFTHLFFRFKAASVTDTSAKFGLDNISVTSYPTGSSPVPDRHSFMNKILKYTDKVGTPAYNSALALFEQPYVTADDISDALYALEGNSTLFVITDIGKANSSVKYTSTDTTGGKPMLVVCAYNKSNSKLYAKQLIKLSGFTADGETENKVTYNFGELPEEAEIIKVFVFSSLDRLVPLAMPYRE